MNAKTSIRVRIILSWLLVSFVMFCIYQRRYLLFGYLAFLEQLAVRFGPQPRIPEAPRLFRVVVTAFVLLILLLGLLNAYGVVSPGAERIASVSICATLVPLVGLGMYYDYRVFRSFPKESA